MDHGPEESLSKQTFHSVKSKPKAISARLEMQSCLLLQHGRGWQLVLESLREPMLAANTSQLKLVSKVNASVAGVSAQSLEGAQVARCKQVLYLVGLIPVLSAAN